jgi:hypothetical protein
MSKKMMLLALAVAALFLLPSTTTAQEVHFSGVTTFTGSAPTGLLRASGWPATVCTGTSIVGSFDSGSTTTGQVTMDSTGCKMGGFEAECNTSGAARGTVASSGTFHMITVGNQPGVLVTPVTTTLICGGFFKFNISGNVIGTITSPACGVSSNTMTLAFEAEGATQKYMGYTGVNYDLTSQRETSSPETASVTSAATLESESEGTLECT